MTGAWSISMQDREGRDLGGIILLDQGHRQLLCDWNYREPGRECNHQAIAAVISSSPSGSPQLACANHLYNIYLAIWRQSNPPRLLVRDAARLLARNDQVRAA